MLGINSNNLEIKLDESSFFLRPSADTDKMSSDDLTIRGTLILSLSRPKRIRSFIVCLAYNYNVAPILHDSQRQSGRRVLSEAHLQVDTSERLHQRGKHAFLFTIVVPSSSPPSERCAHGRIDYKMHAVAQGDGLLSANIETSTPVFFIANPAPVDDTCKLNMVVRGFKFEVGPYIICASSQHLTVGGLINIDCKLVNVPRTTNVHSLSAYLRSTYRTKSMGDLGTVLGTTSQSTPLFVVSPYNEEGYFHVAHEDGTPVAPPIRRVGSDGSKRLLPRTKEPLKVIPFCGSLHFSHLTRLPGDRVIRPSTLPGTKTPIHIRHELLIKIYVTLGADIDDETNDKDCPFVLCVTQPITLSSCCCMLPSLLVPPYSEKVKPTESAAQKKCKSLPRKKLLNAESTWECICSTTKDQLVAQDLHMDAHLRLWRHGFDGIGSQPATPQRTSKG